MDEETLDKLLGLIASVRERGVDPELEVLLGELETALWKIRLDAALGMGLDIPNLYP